MMGAWAAQRGATAASSRWMRSVRASARSATAPRAGPSPRASGAGIFIRVARGGAGGGARGGGGGGGGGARARRGPPVGGRPRPDLARGPGAPGARGGLSRPGGPGGRQARDEASRAVGGGEPPRRLEHGGQQA